MVEIEILEDSSQYFQKQHADPERLKLLRKLEHSLQQDLASHNAYFDELLNMIPMLSLAQNSSIENDMESTKLQKTSKYHKGKASDPLANKEGRKIANKLSKRRKLNQDDNATSPGPEVTPETSQPPLPVTPSSVDAPSTANLSRIEALRIKLQQAIAAKQPHSGSSSEQVSKRAARRAEKNRRRSATSTTHNVPKYTVAPLPSSVAPVVPTATTDIQNIDYGRLTGLDYYAATGKTTTKETKDILQKMSTNKKNLHRLLADAERKKQQLEQLQNSEDPKDKEKAQNIQWSETFKEADGVRIKNDPSKIKKAMKRKEAKKKKSQKAWQSRTEQVQSKQKERQQIRQHNVTARKQGGATGANLSKKKIKDGSSAERPRSNPRPGFEGRRNAFLNSPKSSHEGKKQSGATATKK